IEFDKDLINTIDGGGGSPWEVHELKLYVNGSTSNFRESACRDLIDGLLWCCRPDILSLSITLEFDVILIRNLLDILQQNVKYWKHPLKRMEIDGANRSCSPLDFDLRLKLYW
ncbi:hypothetical protein KSS87_007845, partial [Heliosperma pusillum]